MQSLSIFCMAWFVFHLSCQLAWRHVPHAPCPLGNGCRWPALQIHGWNQRENQNTSTRHCNSRLSCRWEQILTLLIYWRRDSSKVHLPPRSMLLYWRACNNCVFATPSLAALGRVPRPPLCSYNGICVTNFFVIKLDWSLSAFDTVSGNCPAGLCVHIYFLVCSLPFFLCCLAQPSFHD